MESCEYWVGTRNGQSLTTSATKTNRKFSTWQLFFIVIAFAAAVAVVRCEDAGVFDGVVAFACVVAVRELFSEIGQLVGFESGQAAATNIQIPSNNWPHILWRCAIIDVICLSYLFVVLQRLWPEQMMFQDSERFWMLSSAVQHLVLQAALFSVMALGFAVPKTCFQLHTSRVLIRVILIMALVAALLVQHTMIITFLVDVAVHGIEAQESTQQYRFPDGMYFGIESDFAVRRANFIWPNCLAALGICLLVWQLHGIIIRLGEERCGRRYWKLCFSVSLFLSSDLAGNRWPQSLFAAIRRNFDARELCRTYLPGRTGRITRRNRHDEISLDVRQGPDRSIGLCSKSCGIQLAFSTSDSRRIGGEFWRYWTDDLFSQISAWEL